MALKAEADDEHTKEESRLFQKDILWGTNEKKCVSSSKRMVENKVMADMVSS